jgi:ferritin-like metal-binding protein YciE
MAQCTSRAGKFRFLPGQEEVRWELIIDACLEEGFLEIPKLFASSEESSKSDAAGVRRRYQGPNPKLDETLNPLLNRYANEDSMKLNTLEDLYVHGLKDLFSAEQQIIKALPKMAKAARSKELVAGFQEHLEQTKGHAQRLEQILSSRKQSTRGPKCKGMEGVIAEGAEMIAEEADVEVKDAGLIASAQRVEHYEMAGYGTARTYAELLGDKEGAQLLALTLEEERQTDQKLSELAKSTVNVAADK